MEAMRTGCTDGLDAVFGEDASRIRKSQAPAITTSVRHFYTNLFEQEGSTLSLAKKHRNASWNDDCRAKLVCRLRLMRAHPGA